MAPAASSFQPARRPPPAGADGGDRQRLERRQYDLPMKPAPGPAGRSAAKPPTSLHRGGRGTAPPGHLQPAQAAPTAASSRPTANSRRPTWPGRSCHPPAAGFRSHPSAASTSTRKVARMLAASPPLSIFIDWSISCPSPRRRQPITTEARTAHSQRYRCGTAAPGALGNSRRPAPPAARCRPRAGSGQGRRRWIRGSPHTLAEHAAVGDAQRQHAGRRAGPKTRTKSSAHTSSGTPRSTASSRPPPRRIWPTSRRAPARWPPPTGCG